MSASARLSVRMQDIARSLADVLTDVAGEPVPFVLVLQADKAAQYVSNCDRKDGSELIESLLARWKAGRADIPAHYNPDLRTPAAQGDALDAARYRYLRDGDWRENDKLESIIRLQLNSLWDAAIDDARAAQGARTMADTQPLEPKDAEIEALIRQMRNALALPCDRWNATQSRIVREAIDAADAWLEGN